MECLDDAAVLALADGRMVGARRRGAEEHLDECLKCLELVGHARLAASAADRWRPPSVEAQLPDAERYRLGPELARGGMGRVLAAHDLRLDRPVAIKLALDRRLAHRFAREVALTSRLEHPAIVPVHDAGVLDDGTPFYAMRLIAGQTLDRAIAEAPTLTARLALVPSVLAVADAIAYAHSHDVIHRDLKPHNIVIGEFGETVLLDWGLAKDLHTDDDPGHRLEGPPAAAHDATLRGEALGTPGYMAPEQQDGAGTVDRRADVYGLGATLYHVLTGQPPPPVDRGLALGTAAPGVPRELLTVVARAMAGRPDDRYPSAREFAGELRRFLGGSLVLSHRYSVGQRLARWVARNRAAVAVGAVASLAVIALAAASLVRITAERRAAETERDAAQGLVGFMLADLHDRLERLGRLDLLTQASAAVIAYHRKVGAASPLTAQQRATALEAHGDANLAAGDAGVALTSYEEARAALETLAAGAERDRALCNLELALGDAERAAGLVERARATYRAGAAAAARGLGGHPEDAQWRLCRVVAAARLAEGAHRGADQAGAREFAEDALTAAAPLLDRQTPQGARARLAVLKVNLDLATWAMEAHDWPAARAAAERALAVERALAASRPDDVDTTSATSAVWNALGRVREHEGDLAGAEDAYRLSHAAASSLVAREPRNLRYRRALGVEVESLARVALSRGDQAGARARYQASRDLSADLVALAPADLDLVEDLAVSEVALGDVLRGHDRAAARRAYQRSVEAFTVAQALAPGEVRVDGELGLALGHLAELEEQAGDLDAARVAIEKSLALARAVHAAIPSAQSRLSLAERLRFLADLVEAPRARAALAEAVELVAPLRTPPPHDAYVQAFLDDLDVAARRAGVVR